MIRGRRSHARFAAMFDLDMARALRAEGAKVSAIAALYQVGVNAVAVRVRDVSCPVDHRLIAVRKAIANSIVGRREQGEATRLLVARYRSVGMTYTDISKLVGVCPDRAIELGRGVKPRHFQGRASRALKAQEKSRRAAVPDWAERAGLGRDYRDLCRDFGEHHAARECRRLKAEASRACL